MKSKGIDNGSRVRVVLVVLGLSLGSQAGLALDRWEELTQAGLKLQQQGKTTEAEEKLREALSEAERIWRPGYLAPGQKLPQSRSSPVRPRPVPEAESFYQKAIATMEKQPGFDQRDLAGMLNNLALLYTKQGRLNEAEPLYLKSLAMCGEDSWPRAFRRGDQPE